MLQDRGRELKERDERDAIKAKSNEARVRKWRRAHHRQDKKRQKICERLIEPVDLFAVKTLGKKKLTDASRMGIAVIRSCANTSGVCFGIANRIAISAQSIYRSEVLAGKALVASSRHFFESIKAVWAEQGLGGPHEAPALQQFFTVRADATNSSIWQRGKLQGCEIKYMASYDSETIDDPDLPFHDCLVFLRRFADIVPVEDGSTCGEVALLRKQLRAMGATSWKDEASLCEAWIVPSVTCYAYCGECGPD